MNRKTVLRGGLICDGSGAEPVPGEILIEGERIAGTGEPGTFRETEADVIDCSGRISAPGFIDAHSHGELRKLRFPDNRSKLLQGVTTEIDGNCGASPSCVPGEVGEMRWADLAGYVRILEERPVSTNTVSLCGHNSIRAAVMGSSSAAPTSVQLQEMRKILEGSFAAGAAGWSSGLTYFPGKFAATEELEALSETTKGTEKIYATHMRSEGDTLLEAVDEAVRIARAGSERLQVSHLKTIFRRNFHKIDDLLKTLDAARSGGMFLHADRYPYIYTSTSIRQALPAPYFFDSDIAPKMRASASLREEVTASLKDCPRDLPTTVIPRLGRDLTELAAEKGVSVEQICAEIIMNNPEETAAYRCMSPENLKRILLTPWVCAGSDGISMPLDDPADGGHPRAVGTFPRFFRMVADELGIGEAVRKMTSLPAQIFRIPERGLIRPGYAADLVIFDAGKFDSEAGFRGEKQMPVGLDRVMVAGRTAWCSDRPEHVERFGRFIPVS